MAEPTTATERDRTCDHPNHGSIDHDCAPFRGAKQDLTENVLRGTFGFAPIPAGPFDVIVADPPWMYQKQPGLKGKGDHGAPGIAEAIYSTLTNEQIASLPVADAAAKDAHLFMWFTNPGTFGGRFSDLTPAQIAKAWGFEFKTVLTWVKTTAAGDLNRGGMGWYFRGATEHVLYATRGKAGIPSHLREPNVLLAPKSRHSAKPPEFMDLVERVVPDARRLELFCRTPRPGWTAWGNEVPDAVETDLFGGVA